MYFDKDNCIKTKITDKDKEDSDKKLRSNRINFKITTKALKLSKINVSVSRRPSLFV